MTFSGTSNQLQVDPRLGPCFARRSPLLVSSGEFSQPECMKHCRKLGTISPPVQTLSQWQNLKKELSAFQEQAVYKDTDTGYSRRIWLPPTTGGNGDYGVKNLDHWPENVVAQADIWRDYYTAQCAFWVLRWPCGQKLKSKNTLSDGKKNIFEAIFPMLF